MNFILNKLRRPQTPISVDVGTSSAKIVDENTSRQYLRISNVSSNDVFLALGEDAILNGGVYLAPDGGTIEFNTLNLYTGEIHAIADTGAENKVAITEG